MKTLSDKAQKFMSRNPELIGVVAGVRYYEHPEYGDEFPLIAITADGKIQRTDDYELPIEN